MSDDARISWFMLTAGAVVVLAAVLVFLSLPEKAAPVAHIVPITATPTVIPTPWPTPFCDDCTFPDA